MSGVERPQRLRLGYHQELEEINAKVARLYALVSEGVAGANQALMTEDTGALAAVRAGEATIDELMVDLEAAVERVLLLQAPVAGELRWILALVRIVPELERSGDLAVHIAKRAGTGLMQSATPVVRGIFEQLGERAAVLWRAAAEAFAERDATGGERLEVMDDVMDDLHADLTQRLLAGEVEAGPAAEMVLLARFYERLGDHATAITKRVSAAV